MAGSRQPCDLAHIRNFCQFTQFFACLYATRTTRAQNTSAGRVMFVDSIVTDAKTSPRPVMNYRWKRVKSDSCRVALLSGRCQEENFLHLCSFWRGSAKHFYSIYVLADSTQQAGRIYQSARETDAIEWMWKELGMTTQSRYRTVLTDETWGHAEMWWDSKGVVSGARLHRVRWPMIYHVNDIRTILVAGLF